MTALRAVALYAWIILGYLIVAVTAPLWLPLWLVWWARRGKRVR